MSLSSTSMMLREALRRQVGVWPRRARPLWWLARPGCTVVALVATAMHVWTEGAVLNALVAVALALAVRPVRRPWDGLIAALLAGLLVPAVGIAVAARTAVSALAVRLGGANWTEGVATVQRGRRALVQAPTLAEAWAELEEAARQPDGDLFEPLPTVVLAAWCTADIWEMGRTARTLLTAALTGRLGSTVVPFDFDLLRLAVAEEAVELIRRLLTGALAAALLFTLWSGLVSLPPGLVVEVGWVRVGALYVTAFLLAQHLARRGGRSPTFVVLLLVATIVLSRLGSVPVLGSAVAAAAVGLAVREPISVLLLGRRAGAPRLPHGRDWAKGHQQWKAADDAQRQGRKAIAHRLWIELVDDGGQRAPIRAAAAAALADTALGSGEVQQAVTWAERSLALINDLGPRAWVLPQVWAISGRVFLAAGDTSRARKLLDRAVRTREYQEDAIVCRAHLEAGGQGGPARRADTAILTQIEAAVEGKDVVRLRDLLQSEFDDPEVMDAVLRRQLRASLSRGWLALGGIELDDGDPDAAVVALRRAVTGLSEQTDIVEQAVARTLLGAALSVTTPHRAYAELALGVRTLEDRRGDLTAGLHRNQLIARHSGVYHHVFAAVLMLQNDQEPEVAALAAEVAESLRRSALARTLRGGAVDLPEQLRALQQRIAVLESESSEGAAGDLHECRLALADELSDLFAAAYLPQPVQYEQLCRRAISAHVVVYHLHEITGECVRGHVVWIPVLGAPIVAPVEIVDQALLDLLGTSGRIDERTRLMDEPLDEVHLDRWRRLAEALLPDQLRDVLGTYADDDPTDLVIVPHGPLSALPWAALRLNDGRPLVAAAVLQLVPSLEFLHDPGSGRGSPQQRGLPVLTHLSETASTAERRELQQLQCRPTGGRDEFIAGLGQQPAGAYLAVHGFGEGLSQYVTFERGGRLSAAAALGPVWPPWVVFAACLVGRISFELGAEPLGLPISCVMGGAHTVIGGVIEVGYTAGALAARVAGRLADDEHPGIALRTEQLRQLRRGALAPPSAWASLICISRLPPRGSPIPRGSMR